MFGSNRVVLAVIVACVLLAGCAETGSVFGDGSGGSDDVDDGDLLENADAVETYDVTVTRTLTAPTVNETTTIEGTIDRTDRAARLERTIETNVGDGTRTAESEQYVLEGVQYTQSGGDWETLEYDDPEEAWAGVDRLEAAADTLEGAELDRIRTASVAGTETTMFEVNVTEDLEAELVGAEERKHASLEVEQLVYYVYVDTETNTLYGTDLRMEVTQGGDSALVTTETVFSNFDADVEISLPENATDVEE